MFIRLLESNKFEYLLAKMKVKQKISKEEVNIE